MSAEIVRHRARAEVYDTLRDYQIRAVEALRAEARTGARRILLTLPTGGGKTITAASMLLVALGSGHRALFVAHRKELIDQTVTTLQRLGVADIGVVRAADSRTDPTKMMQVASIQTFVRRPKGEYSLIFIDEAHRANAGSYRKHIFDAYPNAIIIGLTATPCRSDGKPLGEHFEALICGSSYSELIAGGHIVAPVVYSTPMAPDLSGVRTVLGDYDQDALAVAMNKKALVGDIVTQWAKHALERTVVFATSVMHSMHIVEQFTAAGVVAEHIDGTTPENVREGILARLASGETMLVSNCAVLTEGWDLPACKRIVLARPTQSLGLYMQMAGRCLRPWNSVRPIILDHGNNVDRHGLPHEDREWSLDSQPKRKKDAVAHRCCKSCFATIPSGVSRCPYCQYETPAPEAKPKLAVVDVDLQERKLPSPIEDDAKRRFFLEAQAQCRNRGWKYGAGCYRYRDKFGQDPPLLWIRDAASAYRTDPVWRMKVAARERDRDRTATRPY